MSRGLSLFVVACCTAAPLRALAYGEPDSAGRPNRVERLIHVFTNVVRQAPHDWPDWDTSLASATPRGPLMIDDGLLEAAHFHAVDMASHGWFAHESSDGTPFETRIARYFRGQSGENIAMGPGTARRAITAWMNSHEGHRENILAPFWNQLGTGFQTGGGSGYFVQDFGTRDVAIPTIPAAGLESRKNDTTLALIANFFDARGRAPTSMSARVDGRLHPMVRTTGRAGNETHEVEIPAPEGCSAIYFVASDADDETTTFPTSGALLAGEACTNEWTSARPSDAGSPDRPVIDADDSGGCVCATARSTRISGARDAALSIIAMTWLSVRRRKSCMSRDRER